MKKTHSLPRCSQGCARFPKSKGRNSPSKGGSYAVQERKSLQRRKPLYSDPTNIISAQAEEKPGKDSLHGQGIADTHTDKTEKETAREALTPKERFERIYKENDGKGKAEKIDILTKEFEKDFGTEAEAFVRENMERITRNKIVRKTRLARKINLNPWNYFCTFTYSDAKHTEESFRKGLSEVLKRMVHRKGWRYIGVWERGGERNRLHFHGIFFIPENGMPGTLVERTVYSFNEHKRQMIMQNTYFNDKFGRNDFNKLDAKREATDAARYLMKYIEKSGEKLVYSRNIPTYFKSDIMEEDVLCKIGQEDKKLLLSDDFGCWEDGCLIGKVSPEVIEKMPKCN